MYAQLIQDKLKYSSFKLRMWNELATVFLFAIVFLVVLKNNVNWIWGVVGVVVLGAILFFAIKAYRKIRSKEDDQ